MGYEGRTASSTVPDEAVPRIRASGGHVKPGSKPRTATAEQLPARRPTEVREAEPAPEGNGEVAAEVAQIVVEAEPEPIEPAPPAPAPAVPGVRVVRGSTPQDL